MDAKLIMIAQQLIIILVLPFLTKRIQLALQLLPLQLGAQKCQPQRVQRLSKSISKMSQLR